MPRPAPLILGVLAVTWAKGEVKGAVSYKAPKEKTEHLIVDLVRGGKYRVSDIADGDKEMTASKEGVLRFATERAGTVKLTPVK